MSFVSTSCFNVIHPLVAIHAAVPAGVWWRRFRSMFFFPNCRRRLRGLEAKVVERDVLPRLRIASLDHCEEGHRRRPRPEVMRLADRLAQNGRLSQIEASGMLRGTVHEGFGEVSQRRAEDASRDGRDGVAQHRRGGNGASSDGWYGTARE